jgi:hypothetical protein
MMKNNFVPIRWGKRRYLIPDKEILAFCGVVNQGVLPRYLRSGTFSLDDPDLRRPPPGAPEVPAEWAPFLLKKHVSAAVSEILADNVAILNVGAKDGLKAGMEFVREKNPLSPRFKILFTETNRSFVRSSNGGIGALPESSPSAIGARMSRSAPLAVGEKLSSRASDTGKVP